MPRTQHASQVLTDAAGNSRVYLGYRRPGDTIEDIAAFTKAQDRRALRSEKKAQQMLKSQGVRDPVTRSLYEMIKAAKSENKPIIGFILSKFQIESLIKEGSGVSAIPCEISLVHGGGFIAGIPFQFDPGLLARGVAFLDQEKFNEAVSQLREFKRKLGNHRGAIGSSIQGEGPE